VRTSVCLVGTIWWVLGKDGVPIQAASSGTTTGY